MAVFTGNANPQLAHDIARYLQVPLGRAHVGRFSDGEVTVELMENVRGRDVFVVQSTSPPANDHLIFSMHSLSFMGLLGSLNGLVDLVPVVGDFSGVLFLAAPVHLFVHMRGVYGVGVFGALWRMLVLFLLSATALGALLAGVALLGLSEMRMDAPGKPAPAVARTTTLS